MARTQEQRKADTRARLLAAASELFARKGFHAVSAEAVADAADRTTGALYSHFGNKEGLLLALLETWLAETADALGAELGDPADLGEVVRGMWNTVAAGSGDAGADWVLLELELWLYGARDPLVGTPLADRYARIRASLAEAVDEWARLADHDLPLPSATVASLLIAMVLGGAVQYRLDPTSISGDDLVASVFSIVGLQPSGSNP